MGKLAQGAVTMTEPFHGTVTWFDQERGIGHIRVDDSDRKPTFYLNDGRTLNATKDGIEWIIPSAAQLGTDEFPFPRRHDRIVFFWNAWNGLYKAKPWASEEEYIFKCYDWEILNYPVVRIEWNGRWDTYFVDPTSVRDRTPEESIRIRTLGKPTFWTTKQEEASARIQAFEWIRGVFIRDRTSRSKLNITDQQCVRIVRHLTGGELPQVKY